MKNYKKLGLNTLFFSIGSIGSKLIVFLMLPLYTMKLTQANYGILDLFNSIIGLLFPLITLMISGALFRFGMDKAENKEEIFSIVAFSMGLSYLILILGFPVLRKIDALSMNILYFYLIFLTTMIDTFLRESLKVLDKVKQLSLSGILDTFLFAGLNIYFLLSLNKGLEGYFMSMVISKTIIISINYTLIRKKVNIKFENINKKKWKEMLIFSISFLPNTINWWFMNLSDRYVMVSVLGLTSVGIYSVSNKLPSLVNAIYEVFGQAWHISALDEKDEKGKEEFYSNVFSVNIIFLSIITSGLLLVNKSLTQIMVDNKFWIASSYSGFLFLANFFGCLNNFYGAAYIINKAGKRVLVSSIIGASVNLILNIIFMKKYGIQVASISTFLSFFLMWLYRYFDTKIFFPIKIDNKFMLLIFALLFLQTIVSVFSFKQLIYFNILLTALILLVNFIFNKKMIYKIINRLKKGGK